MPNSWETEIRHCPACGDATSHAYRYRKNGCDIWQCIACGLGRTGTADFDPQAFYTDAYFTGGHSDGYSDYAGAETVLRQEFARTAKFVFQARHGGKLLDIGCAYGFFLQEARRYFEVAGIELAADAAAHCRRAGLDVVTGIADPGNMARFGDLDVVTLLDVVEHLPSPRETLALCWRHLRPGGIVVMTTGDFASLAARLSGAKWRLMTPPQHLWFFTQESLRRLSTSMGFSLERCDRPAKIVPLGLILFQLRRMLGSGWSSPPVADRIGIPVNLFDAMRIVLRKPAP